VRIARGDGTGEEFLKREFQERASRRGHALEKWYAWLCEKKNAPEDNAQKG
jgi:hypothetical protein